VFLCTPKLNFRTFKSSELNNIGTKLLHVDSSSNIYPEVGGSRFLQKMVNIYQTTWYHIPEDSNVRG
jgi:hypothetical protein